MATSFNRRYYVFDHVIFSMHSLSFQLLLLIVIMALGMLTPLAWWLLWLAPFLVLGAGGAVAWITVKKASARVA